MNSPLGVGTDVQSVLDDASVDIVAICSPPQFHADQLAAACQAGGKAILCEKPWRPASTRRTALRKRRARAAFQFIVGTIHAYDPAYVAASHASSGLSETATLVRSVIYLPPNDEMVALATDWSPRRRRLLLLLHPICPIERSRRPECARRFSGWPFTTPHSSVSCSRLRSR